MDVDYAWAWFQILAVPDGEITRAYLARVCARYQRGEYDLGKARGILQQHVARNEALWRRRRRRRGYGLGLIVAGVDLP